MKKSDSTKIVLSNSNTPSIEQDNEDKLPLIINFAFKKGRLVYNLHINLQGQLSKKQIIVILSSLFGSIAVKKLLSFFS